jgi:hypothetical protein
MQKLLYTKGPEVLSYVTAVTASSPPLLPLFSQPLQQQRVFAFTQYHIKEFFIEVCHTCTASIKHLQFLTAFMLLFAQTDILIYWQNAVWCQF